MPDRRSRLSISLTRWSVGGRNRDSVRSVPSPKLAESVVELENASSLESTGHTPVPSSSSRRSLPLSSVPVPQILQRTMTEPLRRPPSAITARPRSVSQPLVLSSGPVQQGLTSLPSVPQSTTESRIVPSSSSRRFGWLLDSISIRREPPTTSKSSKRRHYDILFSLLLFCMTAIVCI